MNTLSIINSSFGFVKNKIFREQNPIYLKYIKKISCGDGFTVCLDRDGVVYSWGKGNHGQLGYELNYEDSTVVSGTKCQARPRIVTEFTDRKVFITDIMCGKDFVFAYDDLNQPFSWGGNDRHQLARDSTRASEPIPEKASLLLPFEKTTKICCGWMHGLCLTDKGDVYLWGNPFYDYDNSMKDIKEPVKIDLPNSASDIASGFHHCCAIVNEENGPELYTWGANEYGQCGVSNKEKLILAPEKIDLFDNKIIDVVCGPFHTICHMTEDKLYAFGHN